MRLTVLIVFAGLAALVARPLLLALEIFRNADVPAIVLPDRPPPQDAAEARLQDLANLKLLTDHDRSFSDDATAAFRDGVDALAGKAAGLSDAGFEMAVSRLVALAGNGHTTVDKAQRADRFGRVPLRLAWFADGLYVVRAALPVRRMLGRRITEIDGRPVEAALDALRPYLSGTAERARDDSPPILESPALLQAVWPDTDGRRLALGFADGTAETVDALPPEPDPFTAQPILAIGPAPGAASGETWLTVLGVAAQVPLSLRVPSRVAFSAPLDKDGVYIRINAHHNDARGQLMDQLAEIGTGKPAGGWRWIVLDLRFDDGGDEMKTMTFTRALPGLLRDDGNLWILTGNASFSAAIIAAARAKYFAGARAHIVGETAGDRNPFWTSGGPPLVLRNSGIKIASANFKQDWVHGCLDIQTCYPWQFIYGVGAGDLSPEVEVGWRFADYAAGRDSVLERVMELEVVAR